MIKIVAEFVPQLAFWLAVFVVLGALALMVFRGVYLLLCFWRKERRIHVDLPVRFNGETREIGPEQLQFAGPGPGTHLVLITGVGGAGKTSLPFRLCSWGMDARLEPHPVLPVLIEQELAEQDTLLGKVRQLLLGVCGADAAELDEGFVEALLRERRLIVILDHLSELSEAARRILVKTMPPALVIITSRQREKGRFREQTFTIRSRRQRLSPRAQWRQGTPGARPAAPTP